MPSLISNERYALYYQKIGLLYKRPEIRASVEIILSVFAVIVLISAAIRPTLVNVASLQKKIEDQETVDKKADNKITQLLNAQKQLETYANDLLLFDEAVPDGFSYVDIGERFEYLAKENSVKIDSLAFPGYTLYGKGTAKGDWMSKVLKPTTNNILVDALTFSISGKPQNVISFLKSVESMDRLAVLNQVSLTKQIGLTQTEDQLKATGKMTLYFYSTKK